MGTTARGAGMLMLLGLLLPAASDPLGAAAGPAINGDAVKGEAIARGICAACHGADGNPEAAGIPKLAGQYPEYLVKQLGAFVATADAPPQRINPIMAPIAASLSVADIDDVAAYYAGQTRKDGKPRDAARVALGERLFMHGNPESDLPACASCHRPTGFGIRPDFPDIAGQDADYVDQQLTEWMETRGHRGKLMTLIAPRIAVTERAALADYIASLPHAR
jgi:cytochrome c553